MSDSNTQLVQALLDLERKKTYDKALSNIGATIAFWCRSLFLLFLGLKLAGIGVVAAWSWTWVTFPVWGPLVGILGLAALFYAVGTTLVLIGKALKGKD